MPNIINPVVAGAFYPSPPQVLQEMLQKFLAQAQQHNNLPVPKAIIAPHAGYIYSGPIAASAYACLQNAKDKIKNVIILAPAHRYPVLGVAATAADSYATPLGKIKINQATISAALELPFVNTVEAAYKTEHAIEVHLPFLQTLLTDFSIVPFIVGDASIEQITTLLETLWDGEETLIVISSDLSHYHEYEIAKQIDVQAAAAIVALNPRALDAEMACGHVAIRGLLAAAKKKNLTATQIDLRNSGDTAGPRDQVVGYGAFHFR